jgi:hypothetical protein
VADPPPAWLVVVVPPLEVWLVEAPPPGENTSPTGPQAVRITTSSSAPPTHPWSRGKALRTATINTRVANLDFIIQLPSSISAAVAGCPAASE